MRALEETGIYWIPASIFFDLMAHTGSMKNVVKLENYYSPDQLKYRLAEFADYFNKNRYHESLNNVTPADVYFDRHIQILEKRKIMKEKTLLKRRK